MNEIEGKQITGKTEPEEILKVMRERYPEAGVVPSIPTKEEVDQAERRDFV